MKLTTHETKREGGGASDCDFSANLDTGNLVAALSFLPSLIGDVIDSGNSSFPKTPIMPGEKWRGATVEPEVMVEIIVRFELNGIAYTGRLAAYREQSSKHPWSSRLRREGSPTDPTDAAYAEWRRIFEVFVRSREILFPPKWWRQWRRDVIEAERERAEDYIKELKKASNLWRRYSREALPKAL